MVEQPKHLIAQQQQVMVLRPTMDGFEHQGSSFLVLLDEIIHSGGGKRLDLRSVQSQLQRRGWHCFRE